MSNTPLRRRLGSLFSRRVLYRLFPVIGFAFIPALLVDTYLIYCLTLICIYAIYSSSWNLLTYSGQASLGHSAFLGIGGFASSLLVINFDLSPWLSMLVGGFISAGIGLLIGLTCVRLREWYLAMVTFGFAVIASTVTSQFDSIFHGIIGFRTPLLVASGAPFYLAAVMITVFSILVIYWIMRSKIGLAFRAISENESEARMIGIDTTQYKLLAFVISTFFAGLSGALYSYFLRYININIYVAENSFKPLIMSIIGGLGTIEGPIIGSVIMVFFETYLPAVDPVLNFLFGNIFVGVSNVGPPIRLLSIGVFLVVIILFAPKGVTSFLHRVYGGIRDILGNKGNE